MRVAPAFIALIFAASCSSAPRPYVAEIAPASADRAAYEATFTRCSELVAAGRTESFRETSVGAHATGAAVAGAGAAVVAGGAAAGAAAAYTGAAAGAAAAMTVGVGMVVAAPFIAGQMARRARNRREERILAAMDACLLEHGYAEQTWRVLDRNESGAEWCSPDPRGRSPLLPAGAMENRAPQGLALPYLLPLGPEAQAGGEYGDLCVRRTSD